MAKEHDRKTNAMRVLDTAGTRTSALLRLPRGRLGRGSGAHTGPRSGHRVQDAGHARKSGEHYVFMIPVACELDLKKAANVVNEKAWR